MLSYTKVYTETCFCTEKSQAMIPVDILTTFALIDRPQKLKLAPRLKKQVSGLLPHTREGNADGD